MSKIYKKLMLIIIIMAALFAFTGIGFAAWGMIGPQGGSANGDFIGYTIIDLENISDSRPAFLYNSYGFYSENNGYSYETSFTIQINAPLKEEAYDLSITLIDQDNFLSAATITSSATRNSEIGTRTIIIESINSASVFNVVYTITSDSVNYSTIFNNLSSKTISLKITAETENGVWTIDKKIDLTANIQTLIAISKPVAHTELVYNGSSQTLVDSGNGYTLSGEIQTNAGNYNVTATLVDGYCWSDNDHNNSITITATISKKTIGISWTNTSLTYNKGSQGPTATATNVISGDTVNITVSGKQTNAGTYTATATSIDNTNYALPTSGLTTSFTIAKATPTVDFVFKKAYDGETPAVKSSSAVFEGTTITGTYSFSTSPLTFGTNSSATKNISLSVTFTPTGSFATNYNSVTFNKNVTVYAVCYISSTYYGNINDAASASTSGNTIYVIPGLTDDDGVRYTIPIDSDVEVKSGVTLILPYSGTNYKVSKPASDSNIRQPDDSTYMQTKVLLNAVLTNNGKIIVGGTIGAAAGDQKNGGQTCGNFTQITMKDHSKIINNNGSSIELYGYILDEVNHYGDYGDSDDLSSWPKVEFKSGSNVNMPFVIHDFRGGSVTSGLDDDKDSKHVIYFNEYEMPNLRTLMNIEYGATVTGVSYLYASSSTYSSGNMGLIGNSSSYLFQMSSGSHMTIKYNYRVDIQTDYTNRYKNFMDIRMYGNLTLNSLSLNVAGVTMSTSPLRFNLSYSYHIRLYEGTTTINNMAKLMDGALLIVNHGAILVVSDLISYSNYVDGTDSHTQYPTGALKPQIINNGTINATKIAGKITSTRPGASIIVASVNITSYEHLSHSGSYFSTTCTYSTINENLKLQLLVNGSVSSNFSDVGAGTYYSYEDSNNSYGWYANSGKIVYNTTGSTDEFNDKTITIGTNGYTITSADLENTPEKNHYSFGGWYIDQECTISALNYVTYSGLTLYAKWIIVNHNIVYDFDQLDDNSSTNGTEVNDVRNPNQYNVESNILLYPPSYGNYVFDGWYTDSGYNNKVSSIVGSSVVDILSGPDYLLTLYGRWYAPGTETWTIMYSNSNTDEGCTTISSEDILSVNISSYNPPVLDGKNNDLTYNKHFVGWYMDSTFITQYTSYTQITSSTTLYAKWETKNTIIITKEGAGGLGTARYLSAGVEFTIPAAPSELQQPGYDIVWDITGGLLNGQTKNTGDRVNLSNSWNETITVSARAVIQKYTVTISAGSNGSVSPTSVANVPYGTVITVSSNKLTINGTTVTASAASNYKFKEWTNLPSNNTVTGNVTITATFESDSTECFTKGTLITIANGERVPIENLGAGDVIQVFNHETGQIENAPIMLYYHMPNKEYEIVKLIFDNGINIEIYNTHCFFDMDILQYVELGKNNVDDYLGHAFVSISDNTITYTRLLDYEIYNKETECFSLYTYKTYDHILNDMLAFTGEFYGIVNYFEVDDSLKYIEEQMQQDIELYGLYDYEVFSDYLPVELFNGFNMPYLKVAVGKGTTTYDEIISYILKFKTFIEKGYVLEEDVYKFIYMLNSGVFE